MLKESVTAAEVVELLNDCANLDPEAMLRLVDARVHCNKALADHPVVQVATDEGTFSVGILGILNGIFGSHPDGWGAIAANVPTEESDPPISFVLVAADKHQG